ncbi:hypothetical protein PAPYR_10617 [Paratrimastix pyriformis]|uniref:Uncharacterized protein n=1 Tax=Paratrimastix pyriformis TaxID=342808 RepID=A0ABQ8U894_9EUKA|nr:hypothetical protein PAPYR_10617 [Paratrimastix pyriformis]
MGSPKKSDETSGTPWVGPSSLTVELHPILTHRSQTRSFGSDPLAIGPGTVDVPMSEPELGIIIPAGPAASLPPTSALPIPTSPARPHRLPLAPPATAPVSRVALLPNGAATGMGIVGVPQPSPLHPNGCPECPGTPPDVPRRYRPTPDQHGPPLRGMLVGEGYSANTPLTLPGGGAARRDFFFCATVQILLATIPFSSCILFFRPSPSSHPTAPPRPESTSAPAPPDLAPPLAAHAIPSPPPPPLPNLDPRHPSSDSSAPPEDRQASGAASPPPPLDDPTTAVLAGADTVLAPTTPRCRTSPRPSQLGGGLAQPRPVGAFHRTLTYMNHHRWKGLRNTLDTSRISPSLLNRRLRRPPDLHWHHVIEESGGLCSQVLAGLYRVITVDQLLKTRIIIFTTGLPARPWWTRSHLSLSRHDLSNPLRLLAGTNATLNPLFFHTEDVIGVFSYARQHCPICCFWMDYVATRPFWSPICSGYHRGLLRGCPTGLGEAVLPDYLRKYRTGWGDSPGWFHIRYLDEAIVLLPTNRRNPSISCSAGTP